MNAREALVEHDGCIVELGRALTDEEWAAPSLCAGWTNHDVLSHVVAGYDVALSRFASALARSRFSFDRANDRVTTNQAAAGSPTELLDRLDGMRGRPKGFARLLPATVLLGDHTIHLLDIALPLGKDAGTSPETLRRILHFELTLPNPFIPIRPTAKGLSLTATDVDWARPAQGPEVRGRAEHLISVLAGRTLAYEWLEGEGVEVLRRRWAERR
ncbi:MAG: maleylpyruvate isomerase family mycothiol-dependent enzyme [Actinomycetota bacterium]|nr:maleylpyruvate isomerase family mycothiol-dependent enzyme [Acidimicrobiia bacterium]MDQ3292956.1 maleylpyruvate isomerase family mycothiol-dependent enzyme [Actinomycetota bacterium]